MTEIRAIAAHEVPGLVELGEEFFVESGLPGEFSAPSFVETWAYHIQAGNGVVFAAFSDGEPVGGVGVVVARDPFSEAIMAQELFWFVGKSHRRGTIGLRLLDTLERWAVFAGVDRLHVGHLENENKETLERLFTKRGFQPLERQYAKVVR